MQIFIPLLLLLKATSTDRWGNSSRATAAKSVRILGASPLLSTALPPESVCETVVSTKLQQWSFAPKAIAVQRQSNSRLPIDSTSIRLANGDCCREPCPLFRALRHHTPGPPDIPLRSGQASLSPYREYSSYPAEEKVSFSWRKKHLHVVGFLCLRT